VERKARKGRKENLQEFFAGFASFAFKRRVFYSSEARAAAPVPRWCPAVHFT